MLFYVKNDVFLLFHCVFFCSTFALSIVTRCKYKHIISIVQQYAYILVLIIYNRIHMIDFKKVRIDNKYSQEEFANYFGCKQAFISQIERGIRSIPEEYISKLKADINIKGLTDTIINYENRGVPYYDVDFIGGYDLVINDKTSTPSYYIDFQQYNKADHWVNITGHSMEPLISHGDIIAIRELEDWNTYFLSGEIYVVVTDEYRTVKKVRNSKKGDDYFRLIPLNTEFDEQDIPKSIIRKVFQVLGTAKKIF